MVIKVVANYSAAGHDWRWYVVDYSTECRSTEKCIQFHKLLVTSGFTWVLWSLGTNPLVIAYGSTVTIGKPLLPFILMHCNGPCIAENKT